MRITQLILAAMVLAAVPGAAAEYICEARVDRDNVDQGGEVVLTVTTRGDVGWSPQFHLPDLPGVRAASGGTNQSMSVVNGQAETSVSRTWYLRVETGEDFVIGPITVRSSGETCTTDPITIRVTERDSAPVISPQDTGNRTVRPRGEGGTPGDEVFVTLEADRTEGWVGQQIVLTFRYWYRSRPWNNPSYTPPRTEGFWREDLGSEHNYRKVLQGRAYNVTEIRYAVFPTRVGDLLIEPAELSFPPDVFDRFFQNRRSRGGPRVLRTDPVTITVQALPSPQPEAYSGIVATRLDLVSEIDRTEVPRGEAVGLKVRLGSDGFLKGFSDLPVPVPEAARLHDAGETYRTALENQRLVGHIGVEKVIVPDAEGELTVPPVELVWFDADAGRYRTARTRDWRVRVTPSDRPLPEAEESGFLRNEIARLGEDLAFIRPVPGRLARGAVPWTGSPTWWLAALLPVALLGGYRILLQRWDAERRDPVGRRRRRALATARALLDTGADDPADVAVRAICGYVADRTDRPRAAVGPAEVQAHCEAAGRSDLGGRLAEILAACEAARYGGLDSARATALAGDVAAVLTELDAEGGSGGSGATSAVIALVAALLVATPGLAQDERPGADPARLVAEGNAAYTDGDLATAKERYVAARDLGVNDAVLHFNLGNTYAREGRLGRAIASYLRAQRQDPGDRDIQANLAWVRRHIEDLELDEGSLPLFIAQLAAVVRALTLDQWGLVLVLNAWLVAGLLAWGWYREGLGTGQRRALLGVAGLLVAVIAVTGGRWYDERVREHGVIVVPEVAVRSGPAENFSVLFEVHDGLTLDIVGRRDSWLRIGMGGDWEGWVPAASVEAVRLPAQGR